MKNLVSLLNQLADAGLDFVIVGGFAAVSHGSSYVTQDVDICAQINEDTIAQLRKALANWNPRHRLTPQRLSFLEHPQAGADLKNLYLETDAGALDILSFVLGVGDFSALRSQAKPSQIGTNTFWIISLEDLIKAKEAMPRDKDRLVAQELRAIAAKRRE